MKGRNRASVFPPIRRCCGLKSALRSMAEIGHEGVGPVEAFAFAECFGPRSFLLGALFSGDFTSADLAVGYVKERFAQLDLCARFGVVVRFHRFAMHPKQLAGQSQRS